MTAARLAMATALATQPDRDPAGGAATNTISLYLSKCLVFNEGAAIEAVSLIVSWEEEGVRKKKRVPRATVAEERRFGRPGES